MNDILKFWVIFDNHLSLDQIQEHPLVNDVRFWISILEVEEQNMQTIMLAIKFSSEKIEASQVGCQH